MRKSKYVAVPRAVRVKPDIHARLVEMAERDRRSISSLIGIIIEKAVQRDKDDEAMVERINS